MSIYSFGINVGVPYDATRSQRVSAYLRLNGAGIHNVHHAFFFAAGI